MPTDIDENNRVDIILTTKNSENKYLIEYVELVCMEKECAFYAKE